MITMICLPENENISQSTGVGEQVKLDTKKLTADYMNVQNRKIRNDIQHEWPSSGRSVSREEVILYRLKTRHTLLTSLFLMNRQDKPTCKIYNIDLTVKDIKTESRERDCLKCRMT